VCQVRGQDLREVRIRVDRTVVVKEDATEDIRRGREEVGSRRRKEEVGR
jgi:hypothetical protein